MTALEAYILARAYTQQAIAGAGALKGAPCQIQSIIPITGGNRITFAWENSEGVTETDTLDVMDGVDGTNGTDGTDGTDGVGISSITFKEKDASGNNVYTVTLSNTNTYDITCPIGPQGETGSTGATGATGNGIASITKTGTEGLVDTYTITYTNGQTSTFTVTNGQTPTVDSAMSDSSANPVENRVIDAQLKTKANQTQLATVEASTTASKAYSANEYLVLGGVLYKVTDNIAQGGTIVTEGAGKNVDLATVGGELATLKSGLTNVNVALSVPEGSGKNVLLMTIDRLKKSNTTGTWAGNVYTVGYNTYTVSVDDNGVVTSIEGTSTNIDSSAIKLDFDLKAGSYILSSGFVELFGANDTFLQKDGVTIARGNNSSPGQNFTLSEDSELTWFFRVTNITKTSYPMIRPAFITDSTFAPYIPSVESRIEGLESGLTNLIKSDTVTLTTGINGHAVTTIPDTVKVLHVTSNGSPCLAFTYNGYWFFDVLTWDASTLQLSLKPSAETTFTYYYV